MVLKWMATMCFVTLSACSSGKNSGSPENPADGNPDSQGESPQSKEEAIQRLPPQFRANFEAWQPKVIKSCDAAEAFGIPKNNPVREVGVDGATLLIKNKGSVVFSDGKNTAILNGAPRAFSGETVNQVTESFEQDGSGYSIAAEAKRLGAKCTVFLFGQQVFETVIYRDFQVGAEYNPEKQVSEVLPIAPVAKVLGVNGIWGVSGHGLYAMVNRLLQPSKASQDLLGRILELNDAQAAKFFRLDGASSQNSIARISGSPLTVWGGMDESLIGEFSYLSELFLGTLKDVNLEVRLKMPQFEFNGQSNTADQGSFRLDVNASVVKKDETFIYTHKGTNVKGIQGYDKSEAEACAKDRLNAYLGTPSVSQTITPSTALLFAPCKTLFGDIENIAYQNGQMKSFIPLVFADIVPSNQFQDRGWEVALSRIAKELVSQDKSIAAELDPTNKTAIVGLVAVNLRGIKSEVSRSKNLAQSLDAALQMSLDWAFAGANVPAARVTQIIQSADNAAEVFRVSAERLLTELGRNPNANDDLLSFALGMDSEFKNEAVKALGLSKDLKYSNFETDIFNQVIQKKVTLPDLQAWSNRFSAIKTELSKYPAVAPFQSEMIASSLRWLQSNEVSAGELSGIFAAVNNASAPFLESTKSLLGNFNQPYAANKDAIEFAKNISSEFKQISL